MRTYLKTFGKMFRRHFTRLVSIILMVLVSVGFTSGLVISTDKMRNSLSDYYKAQNVSDFIVKSTRATGFTDDEIATLETRYGKENVMQGASLEFIDGAMSSTSTVEYPGMGTVSVETEMTFEGVGDGPVRVYFFHDTATDTGAVSQNLLTVLASADDRATDGRIPIAVERETAQLEKYELGAELSAKIETKIASQVIPQNYTFVVTKIVMNPLHMASRHDVSQQFEDEDGEHEKLSGIFYLFDSGISMPVNDVYITVPSLRTHTLFDPYYEKAMKAEKAAIEGLLSGDTAVVMTLHENFSFESFAAFADKIDSIGYILMAVFLLVTLLVVLSTMTRLLEEERGQIACLTTLGYSPMRIVSKYLLFALVGTAIGAAGSYFLGIGLAYVIYINFTWNYTLPPYSAHVSIGFFLLAATVILASTLAATLIAGLKKTRETPASLLRPRAPRAGGKVLLERIPILWNRISFKYKSTLRNVFRFKTRFFMTVVSVMASTALVLAGLAVLDCSLFQSIGTSAMIGVAVIVLVFAALLNAVVIYTLTNINVSERVRELATLMVLGYQEREVAFYIYREIYITSSIGIALGLPFGTLLCTFIFSLMAMGSLSAVGWYVWPLAALLSLGFTFIVTLMLWRKITRIDMNESLKAIE